MALSCIAADQPRTFRVEILRQYTGRDCTSGYLAADGKIICYTLEKPWRGNKPEISSIPAGTYSAFFRYDHRDRWRIELKGVPGRSNVQLHMGNVTADTKGWILVGAELTSDLCSVKDSAKASKALKKAFYGSDSPIATPDREIEVVVK